MHFYAGLVLVVLLVMTNIFAQPEKRAHSQKQCHRHDGAARVTAAPNENSNALFELHEGTKVKTK